MQQYLSVAYRWQAGKSQVDDNYFRVEGGVLHLHGKGLLDVRNKIFQDKAPFVHKEGQLNTPSL